MTNRSLREIDAVLFDMGGTLRERLPDEASQQGARQALLGWLGCDDSAYLDALEQRYAAYSIWAQEHLVELPEPEIWTRWMLPDYPAEQVAPAAAQLGSWWRGRLGRVSVRPDARQTLVELRRRGYRMGVVSNTTSTVDAPRTLDEYGLSQYFEIIVLSSLCGRRKPDPEIFWRATRAMHVEPYRCAYLGDRISRDVVGSRRAGFAVAILIEPHASPRRDGPEGNSQPDRRIRWLSELLDIFPPRVDFGGTP